MRNTGPRFFARLHRRVADGLGDLPAEARGRHVDFVLSRQQADGGFAGRAGGSDLYYTSFAVQCLSALDALDGEPARRAFDHLRGHRPSDIIEQVQLLHAASLLDANADGAADMAALVESFRTPDGGYGKRTDASEGSTYWSYLAALCYDVLGKRPPKRGRLRVFLRTRQREDGGFSETGLIAEGSTNATTAGVGLAALTGLVALPMIPPALRFLTGTQSPIGGFVANGRVPMPDLLSTFTVVAILTEARAVDGVDLAKAAAFAESCADPAGGYRAAPWDDAPDVEYTLYGLACRGLLAKAHT